MCCTNVTFINRIINCYSLLFLGEMRWWKLGKSCIERIDADMIKSDMIDADMIKI